MIRIFIISLQGDQLILLFRNSFLYLCSLVIIQTYVQDTFLLITLFKTYFFCGVWKGFSLFFFCVWFLDIVLCSWCNALCCCCVYLCEFLPRGVLHVLVGVWKLHNDFSIRLTTYSTKRVFSSITPSRALFWELMEVCCYWTCVWWTSLGMEDQLHLYEVIFSVSVYGVCWMIVLACVCVMAVVFVKCLVEIQKV